MLIEFSVSNFRSIKDMQTLSFLATAINEHEQTNTFQATDKVRLLKSTCIYGANGSGKSNLVKAMWAMINFIKAPFEDRKKFDEHIQPFKLNISTRNEGSFFQIVFIIEGKTYRYGFVYLKGKIMSEWLFGTANKNEVEYFTREGKDFNINKERFKEGIGLESKTREDNLFLNVVFEFNGKIAESVRALLDTIFVIRGSDKIIENELREYSHEALESEETKRDLMQFLQTADADIHNLKMNDDFDVEELLKKRFGMKINFDEIESIDDYYKNIDFERISKEYTLSGGDLLSMGNQNQIISQRKLFNENEQEVGLVNFDFEEEASEGTKKMFNYAGIFVYLMKSGGTIIIDEFDARFHTKLTKTIVKLFNSEKNKLVQCCFVTHDTNLLDNNLLRRDQIYFTEKNKKGETSVYSLNEINGVRNDSSFEKDYLKGKYGATNFISHSNSLFE